MPGVLLLLGLILSALSTWAWSASPISGEALLVLSAVGLTLAWMRRSSAA